MWSASARIVRSGVGEMREIQAPGSYILERRPERTVTSFVQARLEIEGNGVLGPIGCRSRRILADDLLAARRLAPELGALILVEETFQRGDSVGRHAAQPLLIAADRRHLRDNGADARSVAPRTSTWPPA
jgi:hypothetical protein